MAFILLLAAAAAPAPTDGVKAQAQAKIRVLQGIRVTEKAWAAAERRMDHLIRDDTGRDIRLRTIDFE